jgi:Retrotransposon gag protein
MDPTILRQADPAALQPTVTILRLKIKDPDVWSGKRSTLPGFLTSCGVKFMIEEHNFTKEIYKIGYAGSFLGGTPAAWWCTLFQRYEKAVDNPPIELTSFTEFSCTLTEYFGDPDLTGTMERELRNLRQTSSVADYAAEFQHIAGYLTTVGWSDHPLLSNCRANLKDNIKDALVHEKPFPTTLLEMIAASIRIDNHEYEKTLDRLDRKFEPSSQSPNSTRATPTSTNGYAQE